MTTNTKYFTPFLALTLVLLASPLVSHADTGAAEQEKASLAWQLSTIQTELATTTPGTAFFSLSPGQSIAQASSSATNGILTVSLPAFLHTNPDPTIPATVPQVITQFAKITLEFDPCVAVAPSVCLAQSSSSYPAMTSILSEGQQTGYLHYLITLDSVSSTTASFTITDTTLFTTIQNQLNAIAARITALHN
jgi:hypothetical protein